MAANLLGSPAALSGAQLYASTMHRLSFCVSWKGAHSQVVDLLDALHSGSTGTHFRSDVSSGRRGSPDIASFGQTHGASSVSCPGYNIHAKYMLHGVCERGISDRCQRERLRQGD